jgi:uncharacterized membrane protein
MRYLAATVYVAAVTGWMCWMVWLPARLDQGPLSGSLAVAAAATYQAAGVVCHQDPSRSFHRGCRPLPVCARCTGLYVAAAGGGLVAFAVAGWAGRHGRRRHVALRTVRWTLLAAAAPMAVSWAIEWAGGVAIGSSVRALTAAPAGGAVSALIVLALLGDPLTDNVHASGVH